MSEAATVPFALINPVKFIGVNSSYPFCSIISESKLIYTSGSNVIMQNTKNHEQKILFTNKIKGDFHLITHFITLYNENILAIAIKDNENLMNAILIIPLNDILFSTDTKQKINIHYLKNIEHYENIQQMVFFEEGSLLGIISTHNNSSNLTLLRNSNGDIVYQQKFGYAEVVLKILSLNKMACMSVFYRLRNGRHNLCVMVMQELQRKLNYEISLQPEQSMLNYFYEYHNDQILLLLLTDKGSLYFYKLNELEITQIIKVDALYTQGQQKYFPRSFQTNNNQVLITYRNTNLIAILHFSFHHLNHSPLHFIHTLQQQFPQAKSILQISIAKNITSVAVLMEMSTHHVSANEESACQSQRLAEQVFKSTLDESDFRRLMKRQSNEWQGDDQLLRDDLCVKQYIVVQMDVLSNLIEHGEYELSIEPTFSSSACHSRIAHAAYSLYHNTIFLLLSNNTIKFYNLNARNTLSPILDVPLDKHFQLEGFLLWEQSLARQPTDLTIHPFNFTVLLVYGEILKFHHYNNKKLFPCFLVSNIENCNMARYSPLGDKLIISTNTSLIILNSYTYEVCKVVNLPNMLNPPTHPNQRPLTSLQFTSHHDILVLNNHAFSTIINHEKSVHFGFIEGKGSFNQVIYDKRNRFVLVGYQNQILVYNKYNGNTKNRCEMVKKIQVKSRSMQLVEECGLLLIGGSEGVLYVIKWPDYNYQELTEKNKNKYYLFKEAIFSIKVSKDFKYLYALSINGNMCICQLLVNTIPLTTTPIQEILVRPSQPSVMQDRRWFTSYLQEEHREREIVKLRGEESEISSHYKTVESQILMEKNEYLRCIKRQFEVSYLRQIQDYEQRLGIQNISHKITILTDQLKSFRLKRERQQKELLLEAQKQVRDVFEMKQRLQRECEDLKGKNGCQRERLVEEQKRQMLLLKGQLLENGQQRDKLNRKGMIISEEGEEELQLQELLLLKQYEKGLAHIETHQNQEVILINYQNHTLSSKNRSIKIGITNLADRMNDCSQMRENLSLDRGIIMEEREEKRMMKDQIAQQYQEENLVYDRLIRRCQNLQEVLKKQTKLIAKGQSNIQSLEKDIASLQEFEDSLATQSQKVTQRILNEKMSKHHATTAMVELKKKVQVLRNSNRVKFYRKEYLKNDLKQQIKGLAKELEIDEKQTVERIKRQDYDIESSLKAELLVFQYERLRASADKCCHHLKKWKDIKSTYQHSFQQHLRKLQQENLKLTYRFNDLVRLKQDNQIYVQNLQYKIQQIKNDSHVQIKAPQYSLFKSGLVVGHKENRWNVKNSCMKKKLVCVSLHQDSGNFVTEA